MLRLLSILLSVSLTNLCSSTSIPNKRSLTAEDALSASPLKVIPSSLYSGKEITQPTLRFIEGLLQPDEVFDFIVVGGGTAGNTIGVRLAESGFRVAIVEAGYLLEISKPVLGTTPGLDLFGIGANIQDSIKSVDWEFETEPQAGANNRRVHFARGKCLGGSSALNFMLYHRGSTGAYDRWADDVGDDDYR